MFVLENWLRLGFMVTVCDSVNTVRKNSKISVCLVELRALAYVLLD